MPRVEAASASGAELDAAASALDPVSRAALDETLDRLDLLLVDSDSAAADAAQALDLQLNDLVLPTARLRVLRRAVDAAARFDFDVALALIREDASQYRGGPTEPPPAPGHSPGRFSSGSVA